MFSMRYIVIYNVQTTISISRKCFFLRTKRAETPSLITSKHNNPVSYYLKLSCIARIWSQSDGNKWHFKMVWVWKQGTFSFLLFQLGIYWGNGRGRGLPLHLYTTVPLQYPRRSLAGLGCCARGAFSVIIPASNSASLRHHHLTKDVGWQRCSLRLTDLVPRIPSQIPWAFTLLSDLNKSWVTLCYVLITITSKDLWLASLD